MLAGLVSSETFLLGAWMAVVSLCLHMVFFLCMYVCVLIFSYKNTSEIGLGIGHMTSFKLNFLSKDTISKLESYSRY